MKTGPRGRQERGFGGFRVFLAAAPTRPRPPALTEPADRPPRIAHSPTDHRLHCVIASTPPHKRYPSIGVGGRNRSRPALWPDSPPTKTKKACYWKWFRVWRERETWIPETA